MNEFTPGAGEVDREDPQIPGASTSDPLLHPDEEMPCWNREGIYGNRKCPQLPGVAHCRDCAVFTDAVPRLLDRPLPAEYVAERTRHYANSKRVAAGTNSSAVLFRLGFEWFGLPTQVVQEVTESRIVHSIPHRKPGVLLGLANVRGELLICVSLGHLLTVTGVASPETLRKGIGRLVVIALGHERYVFPAGEVHGVFRFRSAELREPPASGNRVTSGCTQGVLDWSGHPVGMLNAEILFSTLGNSLA